MEGGDSGLNLRFQSVKEDFGHPGPAPEIHERIPLPGPYLLDRSCDQCRLVRKNIKVHGKMTDPTPIGDVLISVTMLRNAKSRRGGRSTESSSSLSPPATSVPPGIGVVFHSWLLVVFYRYVKSVVSVSICIFAVSEWFSVLPG